MRAGAELTTTTVKKTAKRNCLCKDMAKFLLCFPMASTTVFSVEAAHIVLCFQKWHYQEVCGGGR